MGNKVIKIGPMGGKIIGYKNNDIKFPIYETQSKSKSAPLTDFLDYLYHYVKPITNKPTSTSIQGEFNQKTHIKFSEALTNEQLLDLQSLSHLYNAKIKVDGNGMGFTLYTNKKASGKGFSTKSKKASTLIIAPHHSDKASLKGIGFDITSPQADGAVISKTVNGTKFLVRIEATMGGMKYHLFCPKGAEITDVLKVYKAQGGNDQFKPYIGDKSGVNLIKGKVVLDKPQVLTFDSPTYLMTAISEEFEMNVSVEGEDLAVCYKTFSDG